MKVKHIFENTYARNAAKLRSWENSRPDYPPEWDEPEFEPTDHGFEYFTEVWSDIQQFLTQGDNLPKLAQALGTHPQTLFQQFRKEKRLAVQFAREAYGQEDLDELLYSDDVMGILRVLKQITTNPSQDNKTNAAQFEKAMAELTDEDNMFDSDKAQTLVQDKYSDY